jgi:uncharacterized protein involved in type VI secretion and phage assembly
MTMADGAFENIIDYIHELVGPDRVHGVRYASVDRIDGDGYVLSWISSDDDAPSAPARVATLMAGDGRGTFFNPEPGDEVVVAFEDGDIDRPVIIGSLWSDVDVPPSDADTSQSNNLRIVRTRLGHQLTFDDTPGNGKVTLQSAGGCKLEMDDKEKKIRLSLDESTYIEFSVKGIDIKGKLINLN